MFDKMKQLMDFKKQADRIKKELERSVVDVEEVRGIKISVTGAQEFCSIEVDESFLSEGNKNRFEKDLLRSVNAAVKKSQSVAAQKMAAAMPGMPGF